MTPFFYRATIEEDKETNDLYFTIPPEAIESLGWKEDDTIEWTYLDNNRWKLSKINSDT